MVGLTPAAKRKVGAYSLGMRQRLGLALAMLGDPPILLLDEPANGLDPEGIQWVRAFLKALASQGRTIFVSSHLLAEMSLMADDLVVIGRGRLIAQTSVEGFVAQSTQSWVVVRSPEADRLAGLLQADGARVDRVDGALHVFGPDAAEIGELAFRELGAPARAGPAARARWRRRSSRRRRGRRSSAPAATPGAAPERRPRTRAGRHSPGAVSAAARARSQAMIDALRSEWVKLRSVTSTIVLFIAVAGVSVGIGLLATAAVPLDERRRATLSDRLTFALAGVSTSLTFLSVDRRPARSPRSSASARSASRSWPCRHGPRVVLAKAGRAGRGRVRGERRHGAARRRPSAPPCCRPAARRSTSRCPARHAC